METKTNGIKPKDFPYTFYLMDAAQEKAYDDPVFSTYRGPVYWNDCGRDFIVDPNQPKVGGWGSDGTGMNIQQINPLKKTPSI